MKEQPTDLSSLSEEERGVYAQRIVEGMRMEYARLKTAHQAALPFDVLFEALCARYNLTSSETIKRAVGSLFSGTAAKERENPGIKEWLADYEKEQAREKSPTREERAATTCCFDCNVDTHAIHEEYMVKDKIWVWACPEPELHDGAVLCIGCLERRLIRRLSSEDFTNTAVNTSLRVARSARLRDRLATRL